MTIALPLTLTIPRKTKGDRTIALNMNIMRNLHYHVMNQAKVLWKDVVLRAIGSINMVYTSPRPPYQFVYTVYPANGRVFDLANVCAAIQKFTDDALQELGVIENDNYKHIRAIEYRFGKIDKERPRCELEIRHYEEGE